MLKNKHRIIVYYVNPTTFEKLNPSFIQPAYAVLLALFDGEKDYEQVLKDFCYITDVEHNEEQKSGIEIFLARFAENLKVKNLLVEKTALPLEQQKPRYNPADLVIHSSQVNLDINNKHLDFPLSFNFNVTTRCQMTCKYCYHPKYSMNEYISLERLNTIFDECVRIGCDFVILSGGDPFERPDLLEIMTMLYRKRISYFISTKSYLDKNICRSLVENAGLSSIQLSLDSADPRMAADLTGMDDGFLERTVETIKNLQEHNVKVKVKGVVTGYNIDNITDLLELCDQLNVDNVQLTLYGRTLWNHDDALFPTSEQMKRANERISQFTAEHGYMSITGDDMASVVVTNDGQTTDNLFEKRIICGAGKSSFTMLPNGEVTICEHLPYTPEVILGDLRTQSIEEFWNSEKMKSFLAPPPREKFAENTPCRTCAEEDYVLCHQMYSRCLRYSYNYYNNLYSPDIYCKLANVNDFRLS